MALNVILRFDTAQEHRQLSQEECLLRDKLKKRCMGLAILERIRKRQCSRITNLRAGDANTKFFHRKVNSRRRKNFIASLKKQNGWATSHEEKQSLIHSGVFGWPDPRQLDFDWRPSGLQNTISLPWIALSRKKKF